MDSRKILKILKHRRTKSIDDPPSTHTTSKQRSKSIENSLILRHKERNVRLQVMKKEQLARELRFNQPIPKINAKSKKIVKNTQEPSLYSAKRLERTHEILKNSRFMPKTVQISLSSLKSQASTTRNTPLKSFNFITGLTTPRADSPITFPSLELLHTKSSLVLPPDISHRNQLILNLKSSENSKLQKSPNFSQLSFQERTQKWLNRKQEKVKEMRIKQESSVCDGCTFKPELTSKKNSARSTQRTSSARSSISEIRRVHRTSSVDSIKSMDKRNSYVNDQDAATIKRMFSSNSSSLSIYNSIFPVAVPVAYHSGFSKDLQSRSKPLISYKSISSII